MTGAIDREGAGARARVARGTASHVQSTAERRRHCLICLNMRGGISLSARDAADSLALFCRCLCAGKHPASDGEADCGACGAGKYAATPLSATACVDCAAGKYTANDAETDCVACAAGTDACLTVL